MERIDITCPRCGATTDVDYYGPCDDCRAALRATMASDATTGDAVEYEPKMNVTPNAVALKDD